MTDFIGEVTISLPVVKPLVRHSMKEELFNILATEVLTEENTDALIEAIFDRINLPWYVPSGIAKRVLDRMLPDVLLNAIADVL